MKKRIILPFIISLILSGNVNAGFPQIDSPNISADIWGNIQKMGQAIQNSGLMDQAMMLGKEMFSLENMATNNAAANAVARENAAKQEIQNIGILEQMAAIPGVCGQVSFSFALGDIGCATEDASRKDIYSPEYDAYIENDTDAKSEMALDLVKDIQKTYPSLYGAENGSNSSSSSGDPDSGSSEAAPIVYSTNANPLMASADAFLALDYDQYSSMSDFISLIVPDYSFRRSDGSFKNMTDRQKTEFMSLEARRAIPEQALRSILALRSSKAALTKDSANPSGNQLSELYSMSEAIKEASSESAIYAISVGETSTPTQLYRQRVMNLTRGLELQLAQFKKGLELEGIQATKLSYLIDK